jgi:hypothetical protein
MAMYRRDPTTHRQHTRKVQPIRREEHDPLTPAAATV